MLARCQPINFNNTSRCLIAQHFTAKILGDLTYDPAPLISLRMANQGQPTKMIKFVEREHT